jgi:hypothetical protein
MDQPASTPNTTDSPTGAADPIRVGLHEAGWYARADLEPRLVDGLVSDLLDLVREQLNSTIMVSHVENFVPLGFDPVRDPYSNVTVAARAILAEAANNLLIAQPPAAKGATTPDAGPDGQPDECEPCEPSDSELSRCLAFGCNRRQNGRHTEWWCDYGCCSRACTADYYGEDSLD